MLNQQEEIAVVQYCQFAFNEIYKDSDDFNPQNTKNLESITNFISNDKGENLIQLINFSCDQNFAKEGKIRRFNLLGPSNFFINTFDTTLTDTNAVLFILMQMYIYKTPADKTKLINSVRQVTKLSSYSPKHFSDGSNLLQFFKILGVKNTDEVEPNSASRFDFMYDYLSDLGVHMFLDRVNFRNVYKSETLVMLHLVQLFQQSGNDEFETIPEQVLTQADEMMKTLLFCEAFYINEENVYHIAPLTTIVTINAGAKNVTVKQTWQTEEDLGEIFILQASDAELSFEIPEELEKREVFPIGMRFPVFSIGAVKEFSVTAQRPIKIQNRDVKTVATTLRLDQFKETGSDSINELPFELNFECPYKISAIHIDGIDVEAHDHHSKKVDMKTYDKTFNIIITKTPRSAAEELLCSGLGYFSVNNFESCDIKKIEFTGNLEEELTGTVKITFYYNSEHNYPILYYLPHEKIINTDVPILCNFRRVKLPEEDEPKAYLELGKLKSRAEHELRFDVHIPTKIVEDDLVVEFPLTSLIEMKPKISVSVENKDILITDFPETPYVRIAFPLKFDPKSQLNADLFSQIPMFAPVLIRKQLVYPVDVIETDMDLDLDSGLLKVTKKMLFDAPYDKEIFLFTGHNVGEDEVNLTIEKKQNAADRLFSTVLFDKKEIILSNEHEYRAFAIGKRAPNEEFIVHGEKKIKIDLTDVCVLKFEIMLDALKEFQASPFTLTIHSSIYMMESLTFKGMKINCNHEKSFTQKIDGTEPVIDFTVEKVLEPIDAQFYSIGNGYIAIADFEPYQFHSLEFRGNFDDEAEILKGTVKLIFATPPFKNPLIYHPNLDATVSNFTSDSNKLRKNEHDEYPLVLNENLNDHEIAYDIELGSTRDEDYWNVNFPLTRFQHHDKPTLFFFIENKMDKPIDKFPDSNELKVSVPYGILPSTFLKNWESCCSNINTFAAFYFDKKELVPCSIEPVDVTVDIAKKMMQITKTFKIISKEKKEVYILQNKDTEISWRHKYEKIEIFDFPFDAYTIGSHHPGKDIQIVGNKQFEINYQSVSKITFNMEFDLLKNSESNSVITLISNFPMNNLKYLDEQIEATNNKATFNSIIKEAGSEMTVYKAKPNLLDQLQIKDLGFFTIDKFNLLRIKKISVTGKINQAVLTGQIEFQLEANKYIEDVYYHIPIHTKIKLSNLIVDGEPIEIQGDYVEEIDKNEEEKEKIRIIKIGHLDDSNNHVISFDFTKKILLKEVDYEIHFPITRYQTLDNPEFLFEIPELNISINKLPEARVKLITPIQNDPLVLFKDYQKTFTSIHFGYAVCLYQTNILPCNEEEVPILSVDYKHKKLILKRSLKIPLDFKQRVYVIVPKENKVTAQFRFVNLNIEAIPFDVYSIGEQISKKILQLQFEQDFEYIENSMRLRTFPIKHDQLASEVKNYCKNKIKFNLNVANAKKLLIDGNEVRLKEGSDIFNKSLDIKQEENLISIAYGKQKMSDVLDLIGLGYFTIDTDFKLLHMQDINIKCNLVNSQLKGDIEYYVDEVNFKEDNYYHMLISSPIHLSDLQIDSVPKDIAIYENKLRKNESLIKIGPFEKSDKDRRLVQFKFTYSPKIDGDNYIIDFPITRFATKEENPTFSFEILNQNIKVERLPTKREVLHYEVPIVNIPEEILLNYEFEYGPRSQFCFFYQQRPILLTLISSHKIISLDTKEIQNEKVFKFPQEYGKRELFALVSNDAEIIEPTDMELIELPSLSYNLLRYQEVEPNTIVKLITTESIEIEEISNSEISISIPNDIDLSQFDTDDHEFETIQIKTDIDLTKIIYGSETFSNDENGFKIVPNGNASKFVIHKDLIKQFEKKFDKKDLGYFTSIDLDLLMIKSIKVICDFNSGVLEGAVQFKISQNGQNEDVYYHLPETLQLSELMVDSEPVELNYINDKVLNIGKFQKEKENHAIQFSFKQQSTINGKKWENVFPITRYNEDEIEEQIKFAFDIRNKGVNYSTLPESSIITDFDIPMDISYFLTKYQSDLFVSACYLSEMELIDVPIVTQKYRLDLNDNLVKIIRIFNLPEGIDNVEVAAVFSEKAKLIDSSAVTEKLSVSGFNAYSIGKQSSSESFSFNFSIPIEMKIDSLKSISVSFENDMKSVSSFSVKSPFIMKQLTYGEDVFEANKDSLKIDQLNLPKGEIAMNIEKLEPETFDDQLKFANLGYFTADNYELLPIQKITVTGRYKNSLRLKVTFTLVNKFNTKITAYYYCPDFVKKVIIDEELEGRKRKNKPYINCGDFEANEQEHTISFTMQLDPEDDKYIFPLTQFTEIPNPEFLLEIPSKNIKIEEMPDDEFLEFSF